MAFKPGGGVTQKRKTGGVRFGKTITAKAFYLFKQAVRNFGAVNEHLRQVMQDQFGQGYDFTYPGIQKVMQAAGRVIRTTSDNGYVWLLDQRCQQPYIRKLLPDWWELF